jgi:HEAT repeat protein
MRSLEQEIAKFRAWEANHPGRCGEWETDYEEWPALRAAADEVLARKPRCDAEISLLLYALARDNEGELIRGMLEEHPESGMMLARAAAQCPDPDARWQIAEFLGTRDEDEARALLRTFVDDPDEYVRRRALLASVRIEPAFAVGIAVAWLDSASEYSRLTALAILFEARAAELRSALDRLRHDPARYVREKVAAIEGAV